jgi:cyclase
MGIERASVTRAAVLGALLLTGALGAALRAAQPSAAERSIQVDKIADNLYVLRGGGGNTAAFVTATGVVLVDTKLPGWGKPVLDKVREVSGKPVTAIINTHTHFDHVGGNVEFPAAVEVIAHENTASLMKEMRPVTAGPEQPNVFKEHGGRGLPTRTFGDRMRLGAGSERIELWYFGRAHTGGDAWVVFPALRVLHAGDAFAAKMIPIIDVNNGGSGVEYPRTLARAAALAGIDTVITGHHQTTLTMADLKTYAEFNREFTEAVQAAKRSGRTIEDVVKTWTVPDRYLKEGYSNAVEYERRSRQPMSIRLRSNVEAVWNETK